MPVVTIGQGHGGRILNLAVGTLVTYLQHESGDNPWHPFVLTADACYHDGKERICAS